MTTPNHAVAETREKEWAQDLTAPPRKRRTGAVVAALVCGIAILFAIGFIRHMRQVKLANAAAQKQKEAIPVVSVAPVRHIPEQSELVMPGSITPLTEAFIYARAAGYVKKRYADIGDRVKEGQVLAEIDAPELDHQVSEARAALAQSQEQVRRAQADIADAQAQLDLARDTWDRFRVLVSHGAISQLDADQQLAAFKRATAMADAAKAALASFESNVRANRANLDRLVSLQQYEKLRAPFKGIITARNFDVGALISAAGASSSIGGGGPGAAGGGNVSELFRVAQIDTLRILVNISQEYVSTIHPGMPATVEVQEFRGREFEGKVTRTSNALDLASRTMVAEVQVPNADQSLLPGMYAQVRMKSRGNLPHWLVSAASIISDSRGTLVATLAPVPPGQGPGPRGGPGAQGEAPKGVLPEPKKIHLQPVQIGRDYGSEVEIVSGLHDGQLVVVNPGDMVEEGVIVRPVPMRRPEGGPGGPQPGPGNGPAGPQPGPGNGPVGPHPSPGNGQPGLGNGPATVNAPGPRP